MVAFGATAALAVALNRPAVVPAALTTSTQPVPQCAAARLAVSVARDAEGRWYPVEFTNTSRGACTLTGYPGIAAYDWRGAAYRQVGVPAGEDVTGTAPRVLLRPGATAHADVDVWLVASGAACQPVTVTGLRVVPPGASRPWYLRARLMACSATGPMALPGLRVQPVQAGPGQRAVAASGQGRRAHATAGAQSGTSPG
jgi:hypothetical protein